jgi:hypothetical protein
MRHIRQNIRIDGFSSCRCCCCDDTKETMASTDCFGQLFLKAKRFDFSFFDGTKKVMSILLPLP